MSMTPEAKEQYDREGWCIVRQLLKPALIEAARARIDEIVESPPEWEWKHYQFIDPEAYSRADGGPLPGFLQQPAGEDEAFSEIVRHPQVKMAMEVLLGGKVRLYTDQAGIKHGQIEGEQGGCSYYHQDTYYWHREPGIGANIWLPLDKVGPQAIALALKPYSHRGWKVEKHESYYDSPKYGTWDDGKFQPITRHRIPLDKASEGDEVIVELEPGDGVVFTNYTWHRSEPNRTGRTLCFYAIDYELDTA